VLGAALMAAVVIAAGCRSSTTPSDEAAAPEPVTVLAVTAAPVATARMRSEIELLGITAALRHITLRAPSSGQVTGFELKAGDRVRQGEVVGQVINREIEAAQSGLAIAEKIDPKEAKSFRHAVKRYASGPGVPIKAPQSAIVSQRLVSSGQWVADLDPLADLIDPASIYVEAQVPIDEEYLVRPGMAATVTSPLQPGKQFPARVMALSPDFSTNSATAGARLEFIGPQRLTIAGAAVDVHVITRDVPAALVIPQAALFEDAAHNTYYVFVAGADGRAHRVAVTIGVREPNRVQVTSGLKPDQMVITSGGYALSDGLKVQVSSAIKMDGQSGTNRAQ
jgi:membrane fusion protein (multidrug efflux system)